MKKYTIVFASSESLPFVKSGGLADVTFALARELARRGHDVHLFIPRYYQIDLAKWNPKKIEFPLGVPVGFGERWAAIFQSDAIEGVKTYLVEHEAFFGRDGLYGDGYSAFGDNAERFAFFSRAVMQACLALEITPDIMHANDWQTALIPIYIKTLYKHLPNFMHTKSVMAIHNIGYQGVFNKHDIVHTQLGWEAFNEDCLQYYDSINFLKGGLLWADVITTVSKKYAEEIRTHEFGYDLSGILKKRKEQLVGITNGADYEEWNPSHDANLPVHFTPSKMRGKTLCKEYLQNELGLHVNQNMPLCATISRITYQKGIDVLARSLRMVFAKRKFQFVLLGSGDESVISIFDALAREFPGFFALVRGYSDPLAHRIEAGSDIYLMPSRYEPCGLNQIYSLKYGTIPVVHATGGLDDTITQWNDETQTGNGFKFADCSFADLARSFEQALTLYENPAAWEIIRHNAMKESFEWSRAAKEYEDLYDKTLSPVKAVSHRRKKTTTLSGV